MKRFFFSLIALSAAAIGCTQSAMLEAPDLFSTEVSFSPYTGRTPETKATSIEGKAGLAADGFYVYGFLNQTGKDKQVYLENELVSSDDNGSTWSYGNLIYWPTAQGSTLDFVAYSANGVDKGLGVVTEEGFTFTVKDEIENQIDLLATAYQAGNTLSGGSSVNLHFYHLLSRVGFKIRTPLAKNAVTIQSIRLIGDMPSQGTLNFASAGNGETPRLTPPVNGRSTKTYTYVSGNTTANTLSTDAQRVPGTADKYLMIMPHTVLDTDHYIEVEYTIGNSSLKKSRVDLPIEFVFTPGKAYEFILNISTSAIKFEVEEEDWTSNDTPADLEPAPEEEEEEEEEEEIIDDQEKTFDDDPITVEQDGARISIRTLRLTMTTAKIEFKVLKPRDNSTGYTEKVGFLYRIQGENQWIRKDYENKTSDYIIELTALQIGTTYEYCAYTSRVGMLSGKEEFKPITSNIITFTTLSPPAPIPASQPSVTLAVDDITKNSAKLKGDFNHGVYEGGETEGIKGYGFCWMAGDGEPSTLNDKYYESNAANNGGLGKPANGFTKDITGLKANTLYSCRAYIITNDDKIYYSTVHTFTTIPDVNAGDSAGGGWGSSSTDNNFN